MREGRGGRWRKQGDLIPREGRWGRRVGSKVCSSEMLLANPSADPSAGAKFPSKECGGGFQSQVLSELPSV